MDGEDGGWGRVKGVVGGTEWKVRISGAGAESDAVLKMYRIAGSRKGALRALRCDLAGKIRRSQDFKIETRIRITFLTQINKHSLSLIYGMSSVHVPRALGQAYVGFGCTRR